MGYTTDFEGSFYFDKSLDEKTVALIDGLSTTRRIRRNTEKLLEGLGDKKYSELLEKYGLVDLGIDGEFYVEDEEGNDVIDFNKPPSTQPSLWCQWEITENGELAWDGNEKFYYYEEWLVYLIEKIFKPKGYILNGRVKWQGEDMNDRGYIEVIDNRIVITNLE